MKTIIIYMVLPMLIFGFGFMWGKQSSMSQSSSFAAYLNSSVITMDKKMKQEPIKKTVTKVEKENLESEEVESDENGDFDFRPGEAQKDWNEKFSKIIELDDTTELGRDLKNEYEELKMNYRAEMQDLWEQKYIKIKTDENHIYMDSTFEEDRKSFEARLKYRNKLKELIGDKKFSKLMENIKEYKFELTKKRAEGEESAWVDFGIY